MIRVSPLARPAQSLAVYQASLVVDALDVQPASAATRLANLWACPPSI